MNKTEIAQQVLRTYGVAPRQIYQDLDKRERGGRFLIVLDVTKKTDKAACATCDQQGLSQGKTTWVSFKRLSNAAYYKRAP